MHHRIRRVLPLLPALSAVDAAPAPAQSLSADEWPLHGEDWQEQRHSPLADINSSNIAKLSLAWSFDDFVVRGRTHRGMQPTPLMRDDVLYVSGPWSVVYALDAKSGTLKWKHDPQVDSSWARKACTVHRGVALLGNTVCVGTLNGWLVALDANSGAVRWRVDTLVDRTHSYTITGAPRVAGSKIIIGHGGTEMGVRGYVSAYDANSGELAWRFFTVPGPGPDEHPEVTAARRTWSKNARWEFGGGTVWESMTYDPQLRLLYVGVGNGGPWPAWVRNPGERPDNLYLSSILAIDASTGKLRWHYQTTPGDSWDYTATQNVILADLPIDGRLHKVIMQRRGMASSTCSTARPASCCRHRSTRMRRRRPTSISRRDGRHSAMARSTSRRRKWMTLHGRRAQLASDGVQPAHSSRVHPRARDANEVFAAERCVPALAVHDEYRGQRIAAESEGRCAAHVRPACVHAERCAESVGFGGAEARGRVNRCYGGAAACS